MLACRCMWRRARITATYSIFPFQTSLSPLQCAFSPLFTSDLMTYFSIPCLGSIRCSRSFAIFVVEFIQSMDDHAQFIFVLAFFIHAFLWLVPARVNKTETHDDSMTTQLTVALGSNQITSRSRWTQTQRHKGPHANLPTPPKKTQRSGKMWNVNDDNGDEKERMVS